MGVFSRAHQDSILYSFCNMRQYGKMPFLVIFLFYLSAYKINSIAKIIISCIDDKISFLLSDDINSRKQIWLGPKVLSHSYFTPKIFFFGIVK